MLDEGLIFYFSIRGLVDLALEELSYLIVAFHTDICK